VVALAVTLLGHSSQTVGAQQASQVVVFVRLNVERVFEVQDGGGLVLGLHGAMAREIEREDARGGRSHDFLKYRQRTRAIVLLEGAYG